MSPRYAVVLGLMVGMISTHIGYFLFFDDVPFLLRWAINVSIWAAVYFYVVSKEKS